MLLWSASCVSRKLHLLFLEHMSHMHANFRCKHTSIYKYDSFWLTLQPCITNAKYTETKVASAKQNTQLYKLAVARLGMDGNKRLFHASSTVKPRHGCIVAVSEPNCISCTSTEIGHSFSTLVLPQLYGNWKLYVHTCIAYIIITTPAGNHSTPVITGCIVLYSPITSLLAWSNAFLPVGTIPSTAQGTGSQPHYKPHRDYSNSTGEATPDIESGAFVTQCIAPGGRESVSPQQQDNSSRLEDKPIQQKRASLRQQGGLRTHTQGRTKSSTTTIPPDTIWLLWRILCT